MTLAVSAWGQDGLTYTGKDMRALAEAMEGHNGIVASPGALNGLKVAAQGSPNATVAVAAGKALIAATGSGLGFDYLAWNDASLNSGSFSPTSTNGRKDRLILRVTAGVPALEIVQGTAAASPSEPSITGDNYLELALVTLPSSTTNITNAMLTDRRVFTGKWAQPWGRLVAASGTDTYTGGLTGSSVGPYSDSAISATYTRVLGRRYLYLADGHASANATGTFVAPEVTGAALRRSTTVLKRTDVLVPNTFATGFSLSHEETAAAAGSDTVKLSVTRGNGSGTHSLFGDTDRPMTLRVYDMGAGANPD